MDLPVVDPICKFQLKQSAVKKFIPWVIYWKIKISIKLLENIYISWKFVENFECFRYINFVVDNEFLNDIKQYKIDFIFKYFLKNGIISEYSKKIYVIIVAEWYFFP